MDAMSGDYGSLRTYIYELYSSLSWEQVRKQTSQIAKNSIYAVSLLFFYYYRPPAFWTSFLLSLTFSYPLKETVDTVKLIFQKNYMIVGLSIIAAASLDFPITFSLVSCYFGVDSGIYLYLNASITRALQNTKKLLGDEMSLTKEQRDCFFNFLYQKREHITSYQKFLAAAEKVIERGASASVTQKECLENAKSDFLDAITKRSHFDILSPLVNRLFQEAHAKNEMPESSALAEHS